MVRVEIQSRVGSRALRWPKSSARVEAGEAVSFSLYIFFNWVLNGSGLYFF